MKAGEPVTRSASVSKPPEIRAMPKSVNWGSPYSVSRMFPGLMSRCRVPARWAVSSAPATLMPSRSTSRQSSGPSLRMRRSNDAWGWYCITMNGKPSGVDPTSRMLTMFGCPESRPIARCSRTNRSRFCASRWSVSTLTATSRSNAGWRQRYTAP